MIILVFSLCITCVSAAKTVYVDIGGNDSYNGLSKNTPKATIQSAIDNVDTNGKIILSQGVFRGKGNYKIIIQKNVSIVGVNKKTTINGGGKANLFTVRKGYKVSFKYIIFKNARTGENGGAINNNGGRCTVANSYFTGNLALGDDMHCGRGAAIYNNESGDFSVINCTFNNNTGNMYGGAINNKYGNIFTVTNSTFKNNEAYVGGGAIDTNEGKYFSIQGSIFISNSARGVEGGAIVNKGSKLKITHSIFCNNSDANKVAVYNNNGNTTANYNFWGSNKIDNLTRKVTVNKYYKLKISSKKANKKLSIKSKLPYSYSLLLNNNKKSKYSQKLPKFTVSITQNNKKIISTDIKKSISKTTRILQKNTILRIRLFKETIASFKYTAKK